MEARGSGDADSPRRRLERDRAAEGGSRKGRPARLLAHEAPYEAQRVPRLGPRRREPRAAHRRPPPRRTEPRAARGWAVASHPGRGSPPLTGVVWKRTWHFDVFERIIRFLADRRDSVRISVTECDRKSKVIVASTTADLFSFLGGKEGGSVAPG